jgi:hypothetical protein
MPCLVGDSLFCAFLNFTAVYLVIVVTKVLSSNAIPESYALRQIQSKKPCVVHHYPSTTTPCNAPLPVMRKVLLSQCDRRSQNPTAHLFLHSQTVAVAALAHALLVSGPVFEVKAIRIRISSATLRLLHYSLLLVWEFLLREFIRAISVRVTIAILTRCHTDSLENIMPVTQHRGNG